LDPPPCWADSARWRGRCPAGSSFFLFFLLYRKVLQVTKLQYNRACLSKITDFEQVPVLQHNITYRDKAHRTSHLHTKHKNRDIVLNVLIVSRFGWKLVLSSISTLHSNVVVIMIKCLFILCRLYDPMQKCSEFRSLVKKQQVWEGWDISLAKVVSAGRLRTNGASHPEPLTTAKTNSHGCDESALREFCCAPFQWLSFPGARSHENAGNMLTLGHVFLLVYLWAGCRGEDQARYVYTLP
jgi:hypothetical protein